MSESRPDNALVGQYFHTFDPATKQVEWQGKVLGLIHADFATSFYLVATFGWIVDSSDNKIITLHEMKDWTFYDSAEDMKWAYEQIHRPAMDRYLRQREMEGGAK